MSFILLFCTTIVPLKFIHTVINGKNFCHHHTCPIDRFLLQSPKLGSLKAFVCASPKWGLKDRRGHVQSIRKLPTAGKHLPDCNSLLTSMKDTGFWQILSCRELTFRCISISIRWQLWFIVQRCISQDTEGNHSRLPVPIPCFLSSHTLLVCQINKLPLRCWSVLSCLCH